MKALGCNGILVKVLQKSIFVMLSLALSLEELQGTEVLNLSLSLSMNLVEKCLRAVFLGVCPDFQAGFAPNSSLLTCNERGSLVGSYPLCNPAVCPQSHLFKLVLAYVSVALEPARHGAYASLNVMALSWRFDEIWFFNRFSSEAWLWRWHQLLTTVSWLKRNFPVEIDSLILRDCVVPIKASHRRTQKTWKFPVHAGAFCLFVNSTSASQWASFKLLTDCHDGTHIAGVSQLKVMK